MKNYYYSVFLIKGMEILFKFGIALLECSKAQLLQLDMEGMQKARYSEI